MSTVATERVLVVPTRLFHELGQFQGFSTDVDRYLDVLLSPEYTSYRPRGQMENDPGFKQLIPYVVFSHTASDGRRLLFQYTRGQGQGEGRLHSKRSVGIGGHISSLDVDAEGNLHPYHEGMRRELEEEVAIDTPYTERQVGLINDDETEVGRVHLGIVHLFEAEQPAVHPREADLVNASFRPIEEILAELDQFETWSQICVQALFGGQTSPAHPA